MTNRRLFLPARRIAAGLAFLLVAAGPAPAKGTLALVTDPSPSLPVALALTAVREALAARGFDVQQATRAPRTGPAVVAGLAGASAAVDSLLKAHGITLPREPESLCIKRLGDTLLVAGRDDRGLNYALRDVARAVELAPRGADPLAAVCEAVESPFLRVRSLSVHPFNADLDAEWYFDERFWRDYFAHLALHRFNTFILTFCDQTNYLNPLYASLAEVPGYERVRVKGLTAADRKRNLATLRRISDLAREHGLDFTLGIWMQAPVPRYAAPVVAEDLPTGRDAADYCARGLALILKECPAISGVQLRMNAEAGVPEERQLEFFGPLFRAMRDAGRPVRLDLRYKGLRPETVRAARELGLNVAVSTKFWCEHFGLAYHPTAADTHYRASRYSYGTMLARPRDYRVLWQLWTAGSSRLLLWGDPEYTARFAQSCRLGGGEGFEVFAPQTNKGYGNAPGKWRVFAERSYEVGRWHFERYWFFHLAFGRLGYNPRCDAEVWQREFAHRFGAAAADAEAAYRAASQVLPLITAAHLPGASEWSWWPEMDTGGALAEYARTVPSDPAQFYPVLPWETTPGWRWETWDRVPGYVDDAVAGRLGGKTTPLEVARLLDGLADRAEQALGRMARRAPESAEVRGTNVDLHALADLARYHAAKKRAAVHRAFFDKTAEAGRLAAALHEARAAAAAWERLARRTDGVYSDNLVFGISRGDPRGRGNHHSGHWKDRLAEVRADVADLEQLVKKHGGDGNPFRTFPGEAPLTDEPQVAHEPAAEADPARDLAVSARVRCAAPVQKVVLHYRALDQTADWRQAEMRPAGGDRFEAAIPSRAITARFDVQYYLEVLLDDGGRLWPSWRERQPYFVVPVRPHAAR